MKSYTEDDNIVANRAVNIAYILSGCFQLACEDMEVYLSKCNSGLKFENRRKINDILKLSKKLQKEIDNLEKMSILCCNEESVYAHDCTLFEYYTLMLKFIQIIGADDKSGLRAWGLYKHLCNFRDSITFPRMRIREVEAFEHTKDLLLQGRYTKEDLHKCIELNTRDV